MFLSAIFIFNLLPKHSVVKKFVITVFNLAVVKKLNSKYIKYDPFMFFNM